MLGSGMLLTCGYLICHLPELECLGFHTAQGSAASHNQIVGHGQIIIHIITQLWLGSHSWICMASPSDCEALISIAQNDWPTNLSKYLKRPHLRKPPRGESFHAVLFNLLPSHLQGWKSEPEIVWEQFVETPRYLKRWV